MVRGLGLESKQIGGGMQFASVAAGAFPFGSVASAGGLSGLGAAGPPRAGGGVGLTAMGVGFATWVAARRYRWMLVCLGPGVFAPGLRLMVLVIMMCRGIADKSANFYPACPIRGYLVSPRIYPAIPRSAQSLVIRRIWCSGSPSCARD